MGAVDAFLGGALGCCSVFVVAVVLSCAFIHGTVVENDRRYDGLAAAATTNQHKHIYTDDNDETNEQSLNRGQYMVVVLFSVLLVIRKILVANGSTSDALD